MAKNPDYDFKSICFRIAGTAVVLIIALLIDAWIFKIVGETRLWIYIIGFLGFGALFAGIIATIWDKFD